MSEPPFSERVRSLPHLGLGISTEFGAGIRGLKPMELRAHMGDRLGFLEIGADLARGVDRDALDWVEAGHPTTYHFLDLNLEEPDDLDESWIQETAELAHRVQAAWICGDAGLWHMGSRDRGHGILMPPILVRESAERMASTIRRLRRAVGFEVLPENPPSQVWAGEMHLLEYFGLVAREADCGLLLDAAHLAIYQKAMGSSPLDGIEFLPMDRLVEVHVAGGRAFEHEGFSGIDDDHGLVIQEGTWTILRHLVAHAPNLRAVVLEAERNPIGPVLQLYQSLRTTIDEGDRS